MDSKEKTGERFERGRSIGTEPGSTRCNACVCGLAHEGVEPLSNEAVHPGYIFKSDYSH